MPSSAPPSAPASGKTHAFRSGFRNGLPFILVAAPFALLFGVVASEAGLPLLQVMAFSFLVVAGASQFAALQFMAENAPLFVIIASALAVNLRMAMYSAALVPHLGGASLRLRVLLSYFLVDQVYALAHERYETDPQMPLSEKLAYFAGAALPICPVWYLFTLIGALIGEAIPAEYGLDFIVPIAFLSIVGPALRTFAHVAAALTSIILALMLVSVPYNLGLLIAALGAMMVGAEIERRRG